MKFLLDTHIVLWALTDSEKLPQQAREIIANEQNEILFSLVSAWEVAIKHSIHPNQIPVSETDFIKYCNQAGYKLLSLEEKHILTLHTLCHRENAPKHNDPFDKMLLSQAKAEDIKFITHDSLIPYYDEPCVLSV